MPSQKQRIGNSGNIPKKPGEFRPGELIELIPLTNYTQILGVCGLTMWPVQYKHFQNFGLFGLEQNEPARSDSPEFSSANVDSQGIFGERDRFASHSLLERDMTNGRLSKSSLQPGLWLRQEISEVLRKHETPHIPPTCGGRKAKSSTICHFYLVV